jgi:hypothetical protein
MTIRLAILASTLALSCVRVSSRGPGDGAPADAAPGFDLTLDQADIQVRDTASKEICNGLDDNNNSQVDEGGVCPTGCAGRTWSGRVYYFCAHSEAWTGAKSFCGQHGMKLARVNSASESSWMMSTAKSLWGVVPDIWLGGTDSAQEGTWRWQDGAVFYQSGKAVLFCDWKPGEPDNIAAGDDCLTICQVTGWNDLDCSTKAHHICEKY